MVELVDYEINYKMYLRFDKDITISVKKVNLRLPMKITRLTLMHIIADLEGYVYSTQETYKWSDGIFEIWKELNKDIIVDFDKFDVSYSELSENKEEHY